ncbi:MAG: helix-turn-helix domain-containing protein [Corynebacteriales bacterium]|nr:helix-turn-helix domain-containing protein [Mycobacteriales bacterium]
MTPAVATSPDLDFERCYRAVSARDSRFDGQFFVAVRTTGIYCRPSCPAVTPRAENVDFVVTAAAAQQGGFRACRRCLPDAVPGSPRWNLSGDLAARAMRLIGDGLVDRDGVDGLSAALGYSPRQLNRVLTEELGAGPLALARANRATNARILIECTAMPMADIAFASGFASVRQFNDTVREVFASTPSEMRRRRAGTATATRDTTVDTDRPALNVRLKLSVRQPFSPEWLTWFLAGHVIEGLEHFDGTTYHRSLSLPAGAATASLTMHPDHVSADISGVDVRDLGTAVHRLRRLLDLDADIVAVDESLGGDADLAPLVARRPGIRVPGAVDGFETLMRTMLGQQISLAAARTHGRRLVAALGEPLGPDIGTAPVTHLFPTPAAVAEHGHTVLTGPKRRVASIIAVAQAVAEDAIPLHTGVAADEMREHLMALPGIGRWTADYVAMRVLGDPDVLLDTDLILRRRADHLGLDLTDARRWSPWRSYVSMHLWHDALRETEPLLHGERPSTTTTTHEETS